jgi:hypothetical protein
MACIILFSFLAFKQYSVLNILLLIGEITESKEDFFIAVPVRMLLTKQILIQQRKKIEQAQIH